MSRRTPPLFPHAAQRERLEAVFALLVSALNRAGSEGECPVPEGSTDESITQALVVLAVRVAFICTAEHRAPSLAGSATLADVRRGTVSLTALFDRWANGHGIPPFDTEAARGRLFQRGPLSRLESPDDPRQPWLEPRELVELLDQLDCHNPDLVWVGSVYEQALLLCVTRLRAAAVCLHPARTYVTARSVLAQPVAQRAKWLQRSAGLSKRVVNDLADSLASARTEADVFDCLARSGTAVAPPLSAGQFVVQAGANRRRSGTHYTPPDLASALIERALKPLVSGQPTESLRQLRVCDPAAGAGYFLVQAANLLERALRRSGSEREPAAAVRSHIVGHCLYGVDRDPIAVDLARFALVAWALDAGARDIDLGGHIEVGNALVGLPIDDAEPRREHGASPSLSRTEADERVQMRLNPTGHRDASADTASSTPCGRPTRVATEAAGAASETTALFLHWPLRFGEVFERGGFDAFVGNPPWVAYAGRAAQPLHPELHRYYSTQSPAFAGYRTLHGLFVHRCATLLKPGGRLGLLLPTSVADLDGYRPTRRAHDVLAEVDPDLLDFGDGAFAGVFQPCMGLTSTRRTAPVASEGRAWPLARNDLDPLSVTLLSRLDACDPLPSALFGERGYQTSADDLSFLRKTDTPAPPFTTPIREGIDVAEFEARGPRVHADVTRLSGRFRSAAEWAGVAVLIRQTARFPIAARSDGIAFRNSILAGFATGDWTGPRLLGYLNSSLIRWVHYHRHRDARQGMPQVKVGHLRGLPCPGPAGRAALERLDAVSIEAAERNSGLAPAQRAALDAAMFDAFALSPSERALVTAWAAAHPPPTPRASSRSELDRDRAHGSA